MFSTFVQPLFAYLDPSNGSMMIQIMAASLLSGMFFLRSSWSRVRYWLRQERPAR
jgi:hypothetical protein